jgi:hypothetical protein
MADVEDVKNAWCKNAGHDSPVINPVIKYLNPCSITSTIFPWRISEIFSVLLFGFAPLKHFSLLLTGTKRQLSARHRAVLLTAHTEQPSACADCCN